MKFNKKKICKDKDLKNKYSVSEEVEAIESEKGENFR